MLIVSIISEALQDKWNTKVDQVSAVKKPSTFYLVMEKDYKVSF